MANEGFLIVKVYDTRANVNKRLVGYLKVHSDKDFHRITSEVTKKLGRVPNQNFYKKLKVECGKDWRDSFSWKVLSETEVEEIIASYKRKGDFNYRQANRLETLKNL